MLNLSFLIKFRFSSILLLLFIGSVAGLAGCSHDTTKRGHIFRCAFEYNRTPWDGCAPDSGYNDENKCGNENCEKNSTGKKGIFNCLKKGNDESPCCDETKKNKGYRRHCGMNPECTAKNPCCRTLGCGMWIDPSDPNSFATSGNGVKACGMTPFCSPMKPCGLTPNCGRAVNPNAVSQNYMNQQTLMLGNNGSVFAGSPSVLPGIMPPNIQPNMQSSVLPGMPTPTKRTIETQPGQQGTPPGRQPGMQPGQQGQPVNPVPNQKVPTLAGPNGLLISKGIVPGVSTVAMGGVVAAAGVITPVGMMTPTGVRLPSGVVNPNVVIKACGVYPGCSAARPCGMTPGCGMLVPINMVSNNAVMLASALQAPGVAGGVMQTGGMMANPRSADLNLALLNAEAADEEDEEAEEEPQAEEPGPESKAKMPLPRFHSVPTKPVFQRSEGLPIIPKTNVKKSAAEKTSAANSKRIFSEESLNEAMEKAYLEGMSAAMEKVEEELDAKSEELTAQSEEQDKAEMQEKIWEQAEKLQAKIEKQKALEQQLYQESLRKEAQIQAHRIAEQKIKDQQAVEEKQARQLATKEQAIRKEAERQMQEREQAIREEAAQELAVQEQAMREQLNRQAQLLEAARIQQVRMTQAQMNSAVSNQPVQQIPVNGMAPVINSGMNPNRNQNMNPMPGGKGMFSSALDFLKGSDLRLQPRPNDFPMTVSNRVPMMSQPMPQYSQPIPQYTASRQIMPQTMESNGTPGLGLYQSAKLSGANLLSTLSGAVSPLSGLLGSDVPLSMQQQPMQPQMAPMTSRAIPNSVSPQPIRAVRQSPRPPQNISHNVTQSIPQNVSLMQTIPVPHLQGSHSSTQRDCPDCLPTSSLLVETKPQMSKNRVPFPVLEETKENVSEITSSATPRRPPTLAKAKKILEVDDEEEPVIRQAKFEDR